MRKAIILEGPNGLSFFLQETLLQQALAERVDLVSQAGKAIEKIGNHGSYQLIIINLIGSWMEGVHLIDWIITQTPAVSVLIIMPQETAVSPPLPTADNFVYLHSPFSLHDFTLRVRQILSAQTLANRSEKTPAQ